MEHSSFVEKHIDNNVEALEMQMMEILCKSTFGVKAQSDVVLELLYVMASTGKKSPDLFDVPHRILCGTPKAHGQRLPKGEVERPSCSPISG